MCQSRERTLLTSVNSSEAPLELPTGKLSAVDEARQSRVIDGSRWVQNPKSVATGQISLQWVVYTFWLKEKSQLSATLQQLLAIAIC